MYMYIVTCTCTCNYTHSEARILSESGYLKLSQWCLSVVAWWRDYSAMATTSTKQSCL